ncbi:WYL domain-containing protein [Undibacterium luofuense]|uniref:WYL domain-containing protein n=1 Tax=Undibacterium luofuense TaxID=2828733 RepID=UPI001BB0213F|nr:WYL domain-containing protein [Undibacterium luofuense]
MKQIQTSPSSTEDASSSRLVDLEQLIHWEGELSNERIRELLGVKPVYASRLMSGLMKLMIGRAERASAHAPLKMLYGSSKDQLPRSPDTYLHILNGLPGAPLISGVGVVDARMDLSLISPAIFSVIFRAIKRQQGLRINYRSMNHPLGTERLVFPHALVRAPRRWHMRAWCAERSDFLDFTLGRISTAVSDSTSCQAIGRIREQDTGWMNVVDLLIAPHPSLNEHQRQMIACEFFPGAASLRLKVRECLAPYIVQDLRLAVDIGKQTPPEYQLALLNGDSLNLSFS